MGSAATITLAGGRTVLVDAEDLEMLAARKWHFHPKTGGKFEGDGYATTKASKGQTVYMHRLLTNAPKGMTVDHINGNGLDNRKSNLRVCTMAENIRNRDRQANGFTSIFKGVTNTRRTGKAFDAKITVNGQRIRLGYFVTEVEAARAYDDAARKHFGEFARLNFPDTQEAVAA